MDDAHSPQLPPDQPGYLLANKVWTLRVKLIYTIITWKDGTSYAYAIGAILAAGVVHCLGQLIWYKCKKPRYLNYLGNQISDRTET